MNEPFSSSSSALIQRNQNLLLNSRQWEKGLFGFGCWVGRKIRKEQCVFMDGVCIHGKRPGWVERAVEMRGGNWRKEFTGETERLKGRKEKREEGSPHCKLFLPLTLSNNCGKSVEWMVVGESFSFDRLGRIYCGDPDASSNGQFQMSGSRVYKIRGSRCSQALT